MGLAVAAQYSRNTLVAESEIQCKNLNMQHAGFYPLHVKNKCVQVVAKSFNQTLEIYKQKCESILAILGKISVYRFIMATTETRQT